jgi:hypothetical protein
MCHWPRRETFDVLRRDKLGFRDVVEYLAMLCRKSMQRCAFVVTAERFREVEARLKSRGIDYIGPIPQLPGLLSIYFYDPSGIRLEFACQPEDGEAPA